MPPASSKIDTTGFTVDTDTHAIRLARQFSAEPDRVFAAWTDPQQVACWWDASGAPLASCEIDLRVGGKFAFASRAHPDRPFAGEYREIARPHLIIFDANGAEGRINLDSSAGGTLMTVEIRCSSAQQLQEFLNVGVAKGTSQTLDNLVAYIEKQDALA